MNIPMGIPMDIPMDIQMFLALQLVAAVALMLGLALTLAGFWRIFQHYSYDAPRSVNIFGAGKQLVIAGLVMALIGVTVQTLVITLAIVAFTF